VRAIAPTGLRQWAWRRGYRAWPPVGTVRWGGLRRTAPVSRHFGFDRGHPVDRWYIERFLEQRASDIRGVVLEFGDDTYARRFGRELDRVDVTDVDPTDPSATLSADLNVADSLPADSYDCIVCTQVLLLVWDLATAVRNLHQALRPGGVLLATVPGITRTCEDDTGRWTDYWRVTSGGALRLFEAEFGAGNVEVAGHGNVLSAVANLHGLSASELDEDELAVDDPNYEVIVTICARRL